MFHKIFTLLFLILGLATAATNRDICWNRNGALGHAIQKFCQIEGLHVPSGYAKNGMISDNGKAKVWINGVCLPPQWIPKQYCLSQFYAMCAQGDRNRRFGNGGCQNWNWFTKDTVVLALPDQW